MLAKEDGKWRQTAQGEKAQLTMQKKNQRVKFEPERVRMAKLAQPCTGEDSYEQFLIDRARG